MKLSIQFSPTRFPLSLGVTRALGGIGICAFLFFSAISIWPRTVPVVSANQVERSFPVSSDSLLLGPLGLQRKEGKSAWIESLEHLLVLERQGTRPDKGESKRLFQLSIRGVEGGWIGREGEPLYLRAITSPSGALTSLVFSKEKTDLFILGQSMDSTSLGIKAVGEGEEGQFVLKKLGSSFSSSSSNPFLLHFTSALCWGEDLFFSQYGGTTYGPLSRKQLIQLFDGVEPYYLYVSAGDQLVLSGEKWSESRGGEKRGLLGVVGGSKEHLVIDVWDESGFPLGSYPLERKRLPVLRVAEDKLMEGAKLRSLKQVSCQMEKRRMILNEGDWLLKKGKEWQKILSPKEIEKLIKHDLKGELFVIDQIGPEGKLSGHYFDEMRTQMKQVSISVLTKESKGKGTP